MLTKGSVPIRLADIALRQRFFHSYFEKELKKFQILFFCAFRLLLVAEDCTHISSCSAMFRSRRISVLIASQVQKKMGSQKMKQSRSPKAARAAAGGDEESHNGRPMPDVESKPPFTKQDLDEACAKHQHESAEVKAANMAIEIRRKKSKQQQDRILLGEAPVLQSVGAGSSDALGERKNLTGQALLEKLSQPRVMAPKNSSSNSMAHQIRVLDLGVKHVEKKLNEARAQAEVLEDQCKAKADEGSDLQKESQALDEMLEGKNPEASRIVELQGELHEAERDYAEIVRYNHTLDHMETRLKHDAAQMRRNVVNVTKQVKNKETDVEKYKGKVAELRTKHAKAKASLEKTQADVKTQDAQRKAALKAKEDELENAMALDEWRIERKGKQESILEEGFMPGNSKEEKEEKAKKSRDLKVKAGQLRKALNSKKEELDKCEEITRQIINATGVKSLQDMVQKMEQFHDDRNALLESKRLAEQRHRQAKQRLEKTQSEVASLNANGMADIKKTRQEIETLKQNLAQNQNRNKGLAAKRDAQDTLISEYEQGALILFEELRPLQESLLPEDEQVPDYAELDAMEMLEFSGKIIEKMIEAGVDMSKVVAIEDTQTAATPASVEGVEVQRATTACIDEVTESLDFYSRGKPKSAGGRKARGKGNRKKKKGDTAEKDEDKNELKLEAVDTKDNTAATTKGGVKIRPDAIKAQQAEAKYSSPGPGGYPKSVIISDDPLVTLQAFLTELPDLK
jgi:hypothetical protein